MSSKRVVAREWKRKRNKQRNIFKLAVVGICALIVVGIGFIGWDMWSRSYVVTFAGQRISTEEFRLFQLLTMFTAMETDDPQEVALEQLIQFLMLEQAASEHNLTLTPEELEDVQSTAIETMNMFGMFGMEVPNVDPDRVFEIFGVDVLAMHLRDIYTADFTIDQADFDVALQDFIEANSDNFIEHDFKFHQSSSWEEAWAAWEEFGEADPEDFDAIIMRDLIILTELEEEELEIPFATMFTLTESGEFSPEVLEQLAAFEINEFSEPIQLDEDYFVIFILDSINIPTDEEIEETFLEAYEDNQRNLMFNEILSVWRETADVQINQRAVNAA